MNAGTELRTWVGQVPVGYNFKKKPILNGLDAAPALDLRVEYV